MISQISRIGGKGIEHHMSELRDQLAELRKRVSQIQVRL